MTSSFPDDNKLSHLSTDSVDLNLLKNSHDFLLDFLKCPICLHISEDPVENFLCKHFYCKACFLDWIKIKSNCPTCNMDVNGGIKCSEAVTIKRLISHLRVKCIHCSLGCTWSCGMDDYKVNFVKHQVDECLYTSIDCPYDANHIPLPRYQMNLHIAVCSSSTQQCPFCSSFFHKKEMNKHVEKCPKHFVTCPNNCFQHFSSIDSLPVDVNGDSFITLKRSALLGNRNPCFILEKSERARIFQPATIFSLIEQYLEVSDTSKLCLSYSIFLNPSTFELAYVDVSESKSIGGLESETDSMIPPYFFNSSPSYLEIPPVILFSELKKHLSDCLLQMIEFSDKQSIHTRLSHRIKTLNNLVYPSLDFFDQNAFMVKVKGSPFLVFSNNFHESPSFIFPENTLIDFCDSNQNWYLTYVKKQNFIFNHQTRILSPEFIIRFFNEEKTAQARPSSGRFAPPWTKSQGLCRGIILANGDRCKEFVERPLSFPVNEDLRSFNIISSSSLIN